MAWVAVDRAVKATEMFDLEGTVDEWRHLRQQIHDDVCQHGFHSRRNAFVQYYGSDAVDASLLMIPLVGFLPADDPRVVGTVEAIQRDLHADGLIRRYESETGVDGLEGREGAFLACTFWFADALHLMGRRDEAEELFEKLLSLRNDVGLLAEEYDPREKRQLGNFPQAFSHVALINTANNILKALRRGKWNPRGRVGRDQLPSVGMDGDGGMGDGREGCIGPWPWGYTTVAAGGSTVGHEQASTCSGDPAGDGAWGRVSLPGVRPALQGA
jgi:GH15 family glucan-1,4-alpha-glucosidase